MIIKYSEVKIEKIHEIVEASVEKTEKEANIKEEEIKEEVVEEEKVVKEKQICKHEKCDRIQKCKGLCNKHYQMYKKGKTEETAGYSIRVCLKCGCEYKPNAATQTYCKKIECVKWNKYRINNKSRDKYRKVYSKVCFICNKEFETTRDFQKVCSDCREIFVLNNKRKYYVDVIKPREGYLNKGCSFPQKFVYEIFKNFYINVEWEFNNRSEIRNPKNNRPLELDIWCPSLRVAVEYDGEQHFKPVYGQEIFEYTIKMDKLKNELCKENNIKLLRINNKDDWKNKDWLINKIGELINVHN